VKKSRRLLFSVAVLLLAVSFIYQQLLHATEPNDTLTDINAQQESSGGYCGIYCLYGAMKYFGVQVEPNELVRLEYIGSSAGSSLAELKKCAEAHGLHAMPVARLTTKDLRDINLPVIIHVKFSTDDKKYNHYELFLGSRPFDSTQDKQALIYAPPKPAETVPFWTIAPRWDGTGLIVSDRPIQISRVFASAHRRFARSIRGDCGGDCTGG
jgi:ABC-type bacteriocin/lantibiotic exporter with double-glycine peptidase domain